MLPGVLIGRNCTLGQNVMVGPDVAVGDNCKIQNNVSIFNGVTLEDNVFCGPSCVFTNVTNPRSEIVRKDEFAATLVKRGATIGANATIVCGNTLGEYCFIAAGAVVTGDVPAFALMGGVPARRIGWMSRAGVRLGEDLVCSQTGIQYREKSHDLLEEI
jgi:UDP-2-acetamido-3-amino-2,3-dideoxy-glucuronate N-acetyltransferase